MLVRPLERKTRNPACRGKWLRGLKRTPDGGRHLTRTCCRQIMALTTGAQGRGTRLSSQRGGQRWWGHRLPHVTLFLLLLAAASPPVRAGCPYNLTLDVSTVTGLLPAYEDEGWCLPFAAAASPAF